MKSYFPIYKTHPDLVYVDSSATNLKPQPVIDAVVDYYTNYSSNIHRSLYSLSEQATDRYEQAREQVSSLIGANSPDEVVFTRGTTESLNLLSYSLSEHINPGDEILISAFEHHANLLPWQRLAQQTQANLKIIPLTPDFLLDFEKLEQVLTPQTRIVSVAQVSNVLGTIVDITKLTQIVRRLSPKALVIVDGAQSVGHLNVNVHNSDVDFYVFSGHKMLGPTGIGILWGKKDLMEVLPPYHLGGNMIKQVTYHAASYLGSPARFEAGTPPIAEAIGLGAACEFINQLGLPQMHQHMAEIISHTYQVLSQIPGLKIWGPSDLSQRTGVFSFTIPGVHPHDISQILGDQQICIRSGHHCAMPLHTDILKVPATARISLQIYNTKSDIDKIGQALSKITQMFNQNSSYI